MVCRVTRDDDPSRRSPAVDENEREQIIQEFLTRKREAEANKARAILEKNPANTPWAANDWNYKINPNKNGTSNKNIKAYKSQRLVVSL